jgi:isopentenyl-diphosphate delta-isomerase
MTSVLRGKKILRVSGEFVDAQDSRRGNIGDMSEQILITAISDSGALFPIEKLKAHKDAQLHLAVSIFIFDGQNLLLQRRARGKYHSPGKWTNTCCTHPYWNESLKVCAARRLREELGIGVALVRGCEIDYEADVGGGLRENERVTIFTGHASAESLTVCPDPEEVEEFSWLDIDELRIRIAERPDEFSSWLRIYMERLDGLHGLCA